MVRGVGRQETRITSHPEVNSGQVPEVNSGQVPEVNSGQVPEVNSGQAQPKNVKMTPYQVLPALDREGWQPKGLTGWVVIQRRSRRISKESGNKRQETGDRSQEPRSTKHDRIVIQRRSRRIPWSP